MKALAGLLLLASIALSSLIGAGSIQTSSAAQPGVYIALGDSIAAGLGSSLPRTRGYTALVGAHLQRVLGQQITLANFAVPGETVESFHSNGQYAAFRERVQRETSAHVPIVAVTVSLGGNDVLSLMTSDDDQRQQALKDFSSRFPATLRDIRATVGPDVPLVVTTYYDLSQGDPAIQGSDSWWLAQFNTVITQAGAEVSARIADVTPVFVGHISEFTLWPLDVHPTNAGHEALADVVWRALGQDADAPDIEITSPLQATRNTPTLQFSVHDNDRVARVDVTADTGMASQALDVGDGTYVVLLDFRGIANSSIVVTIQVEDFAGNVASKTVEVVSAAGE